MPDTYDNIHAFFLERVRNLLHVCLCFSPVGDKFARRAMQVCERFESGRVCVRSGAPIVAQLLLPPGPCECRIWCPALAPYAETALNFRLLCLQFPGLVNGCLVDWFLPWPEDALAAVASRFVDDFPMACGQEAKEALKSMMAGVHTSVTHACQVMAVAAGLELACWHVRGRWMCAGAGQRAAPRTHKHADALGSPAPTDLLVLTTNAHHRSTMTGSGGAFT